MEEKILKNQNLIKKLEEYSTFSEILEYTSKRVSKKTFLIEGNKKTSFEEFNSLVNQCCNFFKYLKNYSKSFPLSYVCQRYH